MAPDSGARTAERRAAGEGRAILAGALADLRAAARPDFNGVVESLAATEKLLATIDTDAPPSQEHRDVRKAVEHLGDVLRVLQAVPAHSAVDHALEAVARALALLYPLARSHQRQRRRVVVDYMEPDSFPGPRAPEPLGAAPAPRSFDGSEKRGSGERVFVEVDIGLLSESHFYTGLSSDLSRGGVFVATYQPQKPGTQVELHFVLPGGRPVRARGIVRWVSRGSAELRPGMGVAFEQVSAEDLEAIGQFCSSRSPLYHDQADD